MYLTNSVNKVTVFVGATRVPEHLLHGVLPIGVYDQCLHLAPEDRVGGATGAVVHWDSVGRVRGNFPSSGNGKVDWNVHWYQVYHLITPELEDPVQF